MTKIVDFSDLSNDSLVNLASANENGIVSVFNYNGGNVTFKTEDGVVYVNATEMAKQFNKQPSDWTRQKSSNEFIDSLSAVRGIPRSELVIVKQGGNNKSSQGAWFHEDVAIEFARWLSPAFSIWCNDKIKELLTTGKAEVRTCVQPQTRGQELVLSTFSGIDFIANALRMNDVSKVALFNKASKDLADKGIAYIPAIDYADSKGQLLSATELLKRNQIFVSVNKFNGLMIIEGFLEDKTRPSSKGGVKHFKSLTDKGLEFGENQVSPHNPRETQPLYYEGKFRQLLSILKIID